MTQVAVEVPETTHVGDGATVSFLIGFTLPGGTPLAVTVDGVALSLGVHYSIVGTSVVFTTAPADGALIAWRRATPIRQTREFPTQATMRPLSIEEALNERTRVDQDQQGRLDRGVAVPVGETGLLLPTAAQRAGRLAVFDESGRFDPAARALAAFDAAVLAAAENGAAAAANRALVQAALQQIFDLASGAPEAPSILGKLDKANYLTTSHIPGDGVADDTADLQAAINAAAASGRPLHVLPASNYYRIDGTLTVPDNAIIIGQGYASRLVQSDAAAHALEVTGDNVTLEGVAVVGLNGAGRGINITGARGVSVSRCQVQDCLQGIYVSGACSDISISGNRLWGGAGNGGAAADITIYGSTASVRRVIISGNYCLSNNDCGISVDNNDGDREVVIANNIVTPCEADGVSERAADNGVKLRFGIIVGYIGGNECRAVVSGNIVRRAGYTGIYFQGADYPSGTVAITGNTVSECGFSTLYPGDESLRAGIFVASGGSDTITGNVISRCFTSGIKISPIAGPVADAPRASVTGNTIAHTQGFGIWCANSPYGYLFANNRIYGSTDIAVFYSPTTPADSGDCLFIGNHVETTGIKGAFQIIANGVPSPVVVKDNKILGDTPGTNDEFNSGVWTLGTADEVIIDGNVIEGYHRGITLSTPTNSRHLGGPKNNRFTNCGFGITGGGTGSLVCSGNTFASVTTPVNGSNCVGVVVSGIFGNSGQVITGNFDGSAPAYGTWERGDRAINPLPSAGGIPGWVCVTGGSPGTWKAEALIES